jgi:Lar family restriction alleviation protein
MNRAGVRTGAVPIGCGYMELKPCPFCTGSAMIDFALQGKGYQIRCECCEARGPQSDIQDESIMLWNTRPLVRFEKSA